MNRHSNDAGGGIALNHNQNNKAELTAPNYKADFPAASQLTSSSTLVNEFATRTSNSIAVLPAPKANIGFAALHPGNVRRPGGLSTNFVLAKQRDVEIKQVLRQSTNQGYSMAYRHHYDPRDVRASGRSNMSSGNDGSIEQQGIQSQGPQGYGMVVPFIQARSIRSMSTPEVQGPPQVSMTPQMGRALQALLTAGNTTISVTADTKLRVRDIHNPEFLHDVKFNKANQAEWFTRVLPHLETLELVINSTVDLQFAFEMFHSTNLPFLFEAITRVSIPSQHWFSGVNSNRRSNPYFTVMASLPRLQSITFTMHNACITDSCFGERQMIDIEQYDSLGSRARKVLPLNVVVTRYDVAELFKCRTLRRLRLEYIECERTLSFTVVGSAAGLMQRLQAYLIHGFALVGTNVHVELTKVERN